ncbi:hypothetical protein I5E97_14415 [Proteus hauseri]|uniref:hypothetical protein n=1 Tax=Proteus cibi TaxID=2050966 RepID=UPI000D68D728|nr:MULTISPECIES: hypothetical protein [Proteus]MBG6032227.1 hypothetical protein [Proteus hauseri]MBS6209036.1 hypothetical protein [Proteus hauseri]
MFNTQALYAWIALLAFSLGWIAQGWHRDNIALEQRMLITAIEDQANMDACLDLQLFSLLQYQHNQEIAKADFEHDCVNTDFITLFNNTRCEVMSAYYYVIDENRH